jgi:flavodoxin I
LKILILYFSQTGNTELIARAIKDGLSAGHEVIMKSIDEKPAPLPVDFDLLFIGSPCHAGTLSGPVKAFLAELPDGSSFQAAGFITHASPAYNRTDYENCMAYFSSIFTSKRISYHGCYECQGNLTPQLHEFLKKSRNIPDDEWERMVSSMKDHPDTTDEDGAMQFAREVALKTRQQ